MLTRLGPAALCLAVALSWGGSHAQDLQPDHKQRVDAAIPRQAAARPKKPRRLLVTNLSVRDGKPFVSTSAAAVPVANYAIERMGNVTGAFEAVFSDDIEMFRPAALSRFDAICFNNSIGVLFDDPALRASLMDFIRSGKGVIGIHDAIATFVQWPVYDQWPEPMLRDRLHVLLSIDPEKSTKTNRKILPVRTKDMDFPMSWIRRHEQGRVFYLGLGHSAPVFWNPALLQHLLAGIQYALGDLEADDTPDATRRERR